MIKLTKTQMIIKLKEQGSELSDSVLFNKNYKELKEMLGIKDNDLVIKRKKSIEGKKQKLKEEKNQKLKEEKKAIKKLNIEVYDKIKNLLKNGYNGPYKSILKLKALLTAAGIPFKMDQIFNGFQITIKYKCKSENSKYRRYKYIDAVENDLSEGHKEDLIEIQGGLTKEEYEKTKNDTVNYDFKGNLTAIEAMRRIVYCIKNEAKFYKEAEND